MLGIPGIPVPVTAIGPGHFVADVIYTPLETELVLAARGKGAASMGGDGMCVYQAADAFRHRSRFLGSDYAQMVAELRAVLERELPAEIARDKAKVDALDMLLSFEAWSRLRNEQRLDAAATRAVLESLVRAVLP